MNQTGLMFLGIILWIWSTQSWATYRDSGPYGGRDYRLAILPIGLGIAATVVFAIAIASWFGGAR